LIKSIKVGLRFVLWIL